MYPGRVDVSVDLHHTVEIVSGQVRQHHVMTESEAALVQIVMCLMTHSPLLLLSNEGMETSVQHSNPGFILGPNEVIG